jgi:hypothetical protein
MDRPTKGVIGKNTTPYSFVPELACFFVMLGESGFE